MCHRQAEANKQVKRCYYDTANYRDPGAEHTSILEITKTEKNPKNRDGHSIEILIGTKEAAATR